MSRVKLLNDAGWYFLDRVKFPVVVDGKVEHVRGLGECALISSEELVSIGAKFDFDYEQSCDWAFIIGRDCNEV